MSDSLPHRVIPAALLLLSLICAAAGYCTQGSEWIEYNGHCYHWSRTGATWFRAELTCQQSGGHLVSIRNINEDYFLLRLTQCREMFWIGMVNTDYALRNQTKGYEWWDGTRHNYTALVPRIHSDEYSRNCVLGNGNREGEVRWRNDFCEAMLSSVCMVPAGQTQWDDKHEPVGSVRSAEDAAASTSAPEGDEMAALTTANWGWVTQSSTDATNECPPGWQLMNSSCYFVSTNRTNYFNAQISCQAMGSSVASILTKREQTLLTVALGCYSKAWIGLEKARPCYTNPRKDNCWAWMDRSPVNFFEWDYEQPADRLDSECVILDGRWRVANCFAEHPYICKKPAGR